jgi:hypothetical protein
LLLFRTNPLLLPHWHTAAFRRLPGYRELRKIQHEKMLAAENDQPENWFELTAEMKKEWSAHRITNMVGQPFPCYKLLIELQEEEKQV